MPRTGVSILQGKILLIGLVAMLLANTVGCKKFDRVAAQKLHLGFLSGQCIQYRNYHGEFPNKLLDLVDDSIFDVEHDDLLDEWGGRLLYATQEERFELRSKGPDGTQNTADDLFHVHQSSD